MEVFFSIAALFLVAAIFSFLLNEKMTTKEYRCPNCEGTKHTYLLIQTIQPICRHCGRLMEEDKER